MIKKVICQSLNFFYLVDIFNCFFNFDTKVFKVFPSTIYTQYTYLYSIKRNILLYFT